MTGHFHPPSVGPEDVCATCQLQRHFGEPDPCFGRLPGALFACCGHGGERGTGMDGYVSFTNGTTIYFDHVTAVTPLCEVQTDMIRPFGSEEGTMTPADERIAELRHALAELIYSLTEEGSHSSAYADDSCDICKAVRDGNSLLAKEAAR